MTIEAPKTMLDSARGEVVVYNSSGVEILRSYIAADAIIVGDTGATMDVIGCPVEVVIQGGSEETVVVQPGLGQAVSGYIVRISPVIETPWMSLRWQDNRKQWSKERLIQLGLVGDMFPTVRMFRMGVYRTRQWEFVCSTSMIQCVVAVEEDMEVLP